MATYRGDDIASPDPLNALLQLAGRGLQKPSNGPPGYQFGFPESAEPDSVPRPGQKGYDPHDQYASGGPPSDLNAIRQRVAARYPALAPHLDNTALQWGDPANNPVGGHLEFFPPWESENPNPGKTTLEFYDPRMQGNALVKAIGGDMLHHLGSIDPRTGQPVDPQWLGMKNALVGSLTPEQLGVDQQAYAQAKAQGDSRSFDEWMQQSRADAYIRGRITPDEQNNWKDVYNSPQNALLGSMQQYLQRPPVSPQNMPPSSTLDQITSRGIWDPQR